MDGNNLNSGQKEPKTNGIQQTKLEKPELCSNVDGFPKLQNQGDEDLLDFQEPKLEEIRMGGHNCD